MKQSPNGNATSALKVKYRELKSSRPSLLRDSECGLDLQAAMNQALLKMLMASDGPALRLTEKLHALPAESHRPVGSTGTDALACHYADLFTRCRNNAGRLLVLKVAQDVGRLLAYSPTSSSYNGGVERNRRIGADTRPQKVIAADYGITQGRVSQIQAKERARIRGISDLS